MAENKDGQEKTEKATPKKETDSRDKGQVAKSQDVTTASILLIGGTAVFLMGANVIDRFNIYTRYLFGNLYKFQLTDLSFPVFFNEVLSVIAISVLPLMFLILAIVLTAEISQVGFHFANKKFTEGLNFKQVFNPLPGLKRVFASKHTFIELIKSFLKLIILGLVVFSALSNKQEEIVSLLEKNYIEMGTAMASIAFEILIKLSMVFLLIAFADYKYQKWKYAEDLKMTKQEVKEEVKQTEGDPKVKAQQRRAMASQLRRIMMQNVPQADVVITNPTHFAVAVKYEQGVMTAPRVVAKGADFLAFKIRDIAKENGVPIVEQAPLARALYKHCDIGQEIPENLFKAVAQVLAYIYSLKNKR